MREEHRPMREDAKRMARAVRGESFQSDQSIARGDDRFGYNLHMLDYAARIANGAAIIVLGFSIGSFMSLMPERNSADVQEIVKGIDRLVGLMTKELVELPEIQKHPESFIVQVLGVIIGCMLISHAREDHRNYQKAFRRIDPFFTDAEKQRMRIKAAANILLGIVVIVLGYTLLLLFSREWPAAAARGSALLFLSIGLWFLVFGVLSWIRINLFRYNFHALRHINIYELGKSETGTRRDMQMGEKLLSDYSVSLSHFAQLLGVLGALALYFLPTLRTTYFWIPLVICVVLLVVIDNSIMRYAQRKYEPEFD